MKMLVRFVIVLVCLTSISLFAKGSKQPAPPPEPELKIVQVDPVSVTVSKGRTSSTQTYKIDKDTQITVNGVSGKVADLRAGMTAVIRSSGDAASSIAAKSPTPPKREKPKSPVYDWTW